MIGILLASGSLELQAIGESIQNAGRTSEDYEEGEDPPLVDSGFAADVIGAALQALTAAAPERASSMWQASGLQLTAYLPSVSQHAHNDTDRCTLLEVQWALTVEN